MSARQEVANFFLGKDGTSIFSSPSIWSEIISMDRHLVGEGFDPLVEMAWRVRISGLNH